MHFEKSIPVIVALGFLVGVAFSLGGCSGASKLTPRASVPGKVTLASGDMLDIKFFKTPELNETQVVRPDGKIVLQLIGEVDVRGMSPEELQNHLIQQYENQLKNPEISVIVRTFYSRRVYVGGEVRTPGFVEMPGQLTILEAIMATGGFIAESSTISKVMVIRQDDGQQRRYTVDVSKAFENAESMPFYLEPFDVVYVPQSGIAKVNQWVEQHINNVVPQFGLVFTRPVGEGNLGIGSYRY